MTRQEILKLVEKCEDLIEWAWTSDGGKPGWRGTANMGGALEHFGEIREAVRPFRKQGFSRLKE